MLMMVRRTHVSIFWLEGQARPIIQRPMIQTIQTKEVENHDTGKFD
jgi:hypothetical protein